jgi:hypothetical protein
VTKKNSEQEQFFFLHFFSPFRDDFNGTKNQHRYLDLLDGRIENGQNVRVFNFRWTELDVWSYIEQERNQKPFHLFFTQTQSVFTRQNDLVKLGLFFRR